MPRYELSGGDGAAYGPVFGPVRVESLFETSCAETGVRYLIMAPVEPLEFQGTPITQLAISMRYTGEHVDELPDRDAIVAISSVRPEAEATLRSGIQARNLHGIAVGCCRPLTD